MHEWALYHRKLGFAKIILYDNNSSRPYDEELGDMIGEGYIELRNWPSEQWSRQLRAYNDFVQSEKWGGNDYCAFIDVDEFLFFNRAKSIAEFMCCYEEFAGVGLNWKLYNANGRIEAPQGIPTMEAYAGVRLL